ncbi:MAG: hypothetical protein IJ335_00655 [Lachnospiraceae bacterium]|nr:hypothetical protein [Lachnospiraceae bacterium]
MKAHLLYDHKEWIRIKNYYDSRSIVQDLGLETLFVAAAKGVIKERDEIKAITEEDLFVKNTMRQVMLVPLESADEILYRQEIIRDCFANEEFICALFDLSQEILDKWDKLGRRDNDRMSMRNTPAFLVNEIHILRLFVSGLSRIKSLLAIYATRLESRGLSGLYERLCREYPEELEKQLNQILEDISFYVSAASGTIEFDKEYKPNIVLGCTLGGGMKFENLKLEQVSTDVRRYHAPGSAIGHAKEFMRSLTPNSIAAQKGAGVAPNIAELEYQIVAYVVGCFAPFVNDFGDFFVQLHMQSAFYRGAVNLKHHLMRYDLPSCYPTVGAQDSLRFENLKEFVMCIEQRINPVGNTCDIRDKMLLVVTGANQGGKSTFLRSIGIAQVMMQCGLPVAAVAYESGIFPQFFTHFTRREDSAMNSGRLDEELNRMNQIIEHLGERSMILLNESFATTTEKEGSVIAYDIVRALKEADVKILTVTHLLSFAQRMYDEVDTGMQKGVEFLCAERLTDGKRTFRMIQHAPELTSFGLDLFEELVGGLEIS